MAQSILENNAAALTGGQGLARQLVAEGVRHVFALPGVQLDWAFDALIDVQSQIKVIVPRHEQATSYMADGYARASGETGVCMVVPGPGVLNALSGLATAYACSSPVVCIAGQIRTPAIGHGLGLLHEVPGQSEVLKSVTKWSALARSPEEVPELVHEAFRRAQSGRPRPVAVEIPPDVLEARAAMTFHERATRERAAAPSTEILKDAASILASARAPAIWAGNGVVAADAQSELTRLAERLGAPVMMSDNGRGAISDHHPLALTALGARAVLPHADVVLVVGSRFLNLRGQPAVDAPQARFIYINVEAADTDAPRPSGLAIIGDAKIALNHLADAVPARDQSGAVAACARVRDWCDHQFASIEPQRGWLQALRRAIPENGILINELTQVGYPAPLAFPVYTPRTFITPGYQGTLGYGFPTGLGAATAHPDRVVVSISGDGGFGWNLQELATAARYRIPLIVVVFSDGSFGNVRRIQREVFGREFCSTLANPDFQALARAFNVEAARADSPSELQNLIATAAATRRTPLLIEVPVGEMPSPWHLLHRLSRPPAHEPPNPLGEPSANQQARPWGAP
ncbi:MAG TPA: thiamine pyrophosphate-dependent enzyme [Steroidobacter sp.]|uniref:thiamine pyrophosphate-dependent enzyme n=1 Tax=Steroidobacter sp. TaxID=1978227 RepID=UPI002EDA8DE1